MKHVEIFSPPSKWDNTKQCMIGKPPTRIFLAGTIDMGNSDDWQKELINNIKNTEFKRPVNVYNPRRDEFPPGYEHEEVRRQTEWELYHLERADKIFMNILADSKSPISLLELGLYAKEGKLTVFCPKTYYRYDNVLIVCNRYGIPLFNTNNIEVISEKVFEYIGIDEK